MNTLLNHSGEYKVSADIMNISKYWLTDEKEAMEKLVDNAHLNSVQKAAVKQRAHELVVAVRKNRLKKSGIDAFMIEYDLSSEEGIVLMCLAEALLRVPDKYTIDLLIKDKLTSAAWKEHVGTEKHLFVNAATWSLMLTGKILKDTKKRPFRSVFQSMIKKSSEPVIRKAIKQAMKIVGKQYVLGETIEEALKVSQKRVEKGYTYSYDMLGEAAMTMADAEYYYGQYVHAIEKLAKYATNKEIKDNPGISVKLSALHPRYEVAKHERVHKEIYPKLLKLTQMAKDYNVGMNIDAEETERLQISLELVERLAHEESLQNFDGIGIVVQAYQKRAPYVLDFLADVAKKTNRRFMIRLVKGAYWDAEIKHAQEQGLNGYPVFTRKHHTDVSYQACIRQLFELSDYIYPQFATHNAQTVATVVELANGSTDYEFQCLHGMGDPLYDNIVGNPAYNGVPCRIYAPVGGHEHLLAYLVRRLLENGANSSFVNRIVDENLPVEELIEDPVKKAVDHGCGQHPGIPYPKDIVAPRLNSQGYNTNDFATLEKMYAEIYKHTKATYNAKYLVTGEKANKDNAEDILNPNTNEVIGTVYNADKEVAMKAMKFARRAFPEWNATPADKRASILEEFANLLEANTEKFIAIAMVEAGKTLANAIDEVREAVDFCRYYAAQAREQFSGPIQVPSLAESLKQIELTGRGPMVCISPWNFPLAIFLGQITAALAAGNTVVAKPAEQTPAIAYEAVKLFYKAGLPEEVLQFVPGSGEVVGDTLIKSHFVKGVIFTGSTEVANIIHQNLASKDGEIIPFVAETGGQNAMIVDSSALPEQVTADVVRSAFDSAGQRCSALRVLCLQEDIADSYIKMIKGAMMELKVADSKFLDTDVGPAIDKEAADNLNAYIAEKKDKFKLLYQVPENEETKKGTFVLPVMFEIEKLSDLGREQFGPVLHVLRFKGNKLKELVRDINATGYGLTCGVHSRINEVVNYVKDNIRAGNTYVNRNIVGAVVGVQPFGGQGKSGTGPKAGGPFYMHRLANETLSNVGAQEVVCNLEKEQADEKNIYKHVRSSYKVTNLLEDVRAREGIATELKGSKGTIGSMLTATPAMADKAIATAAAQAEAWNAINAEKRAWYIEKFVMLLEDNKDKIAACIVAESGKTALEAQKDIDKALQLVSFYCLQARQEFTHPVRLPSPTGEIDEISLQGRGVTVSICSSDDSIIRFVGQTVAALLAGNTVVAKPAYTGNLAAYHIVKLMIKAGIDSKVIQLLLGDSEELTANLLFNQKVALVAFSGSVGGVKQVQQALALRRGAIIPFVAESVAKDGHSTKLAIETASPLYMRRFVVEKTISIDTTASGGNASLMSLEE